MRHPAPRRLAHWLGRNWARLHYARHVEPTWLEVNRLRVPVRGLPPAFDGFRVVQLSDLHCGPKVTRAYIDEAIDLALHEKPDIVVLTGVDDLWSRTCDLDRAYADHEPARPRLVLAHNPRTVERLRGRRCDLMLSGHTHGGQVDWPGLGRVTLGKKARRFAAGLYVHAGTHLYVNKGVGFGWRFRFGARPEVAVLTLRPA